MKKAIASILVLLALFAFALPVTAAEEAASPSAVEIVAEILGELMEGLFGNEAPESDSNEGEDGGGLPDLGPSVDPGG
ncbi:MAG: hypothetical protein AAFX50_26070 [Acidobacteriota bacterium]